LDPELLSKQERRNMKTLPEWITSEVVLTRQVFWKKNPGSKGDYEARCKNGKSFFDKNKNKINILMEVLSRRNYNVLRLQKITRIYKLKRKAFKILFQHLENIPYDPVYYISFLITTRPPSSHPPTKTKKIKLTNEKAFQKYTKSFQRDFALVYNSFKIDPDVTFPKTQDPKGTFPVSTKSLSRPEPQKNTRDSSVFTSPRAYGKVRKPLL